MREKDEVREIFERVGEGEVGEVVGGVLYGDGGSWKFEYLINFGSVCVLINVSLQ